MNKNQKKHIHMKSLSSICHVVQLCKLLCRTITPGSVPRRAYNGLVDVLILWMGHWSQYVGP